MGWAFLRGGVGSKNINHVRRDFGFEPVIQAATHKGIGDQTGGT